LGIFGTSARLELGAKTERYKRSMVSAIAFSGEKTTGLETDFFTGNYEKTDIFNNHLFLWLLTEDL